MSQIAAVRAEKDRFYRSHPQSPLTRAQKESFEGLHYYPENPGLVFRIRPDVLPDQEPVEMKTSTGQTVTYTRWALAHLTIEGREVALTIFRDPGTGDLFLPFQDAGRGSETYGAGRYLEVSSLEGGQLLLDFNYAYNPYCAYNDDWSCPIPPAENRLDVPVRAGEMTFK
ncbi:MAG: DUF1684 domain-containing protein [Dehalococcoidia bacterium]